MHLVGVITSYEGSGTDCSYMPVGEGDHTLGCAISKVGRGALVVCMEGGPAVSAAPRIGAVASLMSRIFAVTFETVDEGGECLLALPKCTTRRTP